MSRLNGPRRRRRSSSTVESDAQNQFFGLTAIVLVVALVGPIVVALFACKVASDYVDKCVPAQGSSEP